ATVIFMVVNVPILRTLVYMQVNLHVVNLIFLSLLLWRRKPFLSALALALAVHFKASPIILVFAFILERDWRWLAWFTLNFFLIGAFSYLSHGISPFVDFVHNVLSLPASRGINFRENSFDSLFFALTTFFKADNFPTQYLIYIVKFIVGVITLIVVAANIKHQTFYKEETRGKYLFNSIPALLVLLTLASPIVWVHHGVFLALAFLVILKRLSSSFQWTLYGFAYFLEFLVPTFDFFPWSYGRLLSPMIILGLLWLLPRQQNRPSVFEAINCWLPKINTIRDASSGEGI
ncbi:MAG: glycosyltransferase 87 family protein, partial [Chloroflexota bacterium]|nr:glycosyltransferase 87 family protein [Chloroflexota bacterium]